MNLFGKVPCLYLKYTEEKCFLLSFSKWAKLRMWSERRERCGRRGGGGDVGGGGFTGTQTDRQQTGCPKLRWSFTLQHRAAVRPPAPLLLSLSHRPPASARITQLQGRGRLAEQTGNLICFSPLGLSATSPPPARAPALRTWRRGVCCRYQPRSAQPASWRSTGLTPSEEPLAWMHYGHACLQGSVFRRHRSI